MGAASADSWRGRVTYETRVRWVRVYTALGWPICTAAYTGADGCSCGSPGCTTPGAHPTSVATTASTEVAARLRDDPKANLMVSTGDAVEAVAVPVPLGRLALSRMRAKGPVAVSGDSYVFFLVGGPPLVGADVQCYDTGCHVLVPPSTVPEGDSVTWIYGPRHPLPTAEMLAHALALP